MRDARGNRCSHGISTPTEPAQAEPFASLLKFITLRNMAVTAFTLLTCLVRGSGN